MTTGFAAFDRAIEDKLAADDALRLAEIQSRVAGEALIRARAALGAAMDAVWAVVYDAMNPPAGPVEQPPRSGDASPKPADAPVVAPSRPIYDGSLWADL